MNAVKAIFAAAIASVTFAGGALADGHSKGEKYNAAKCTAAKAGDDLTAREAYDVYACLADDLYVGYNSPKDKRWINAEHVRDYRNWWPASTLPSAPGTHSGRFLFSYVNSIGANAYGKFADNPSIPVGTVIAKESFSVNDAGKARKGPLFFMEKVAAGKSPKTNDWFYTMVNPNGAPAAINVFTACNECHSGFAETGFLGYPEEEVRRLR